MYPYFHSQGALSTGVYWKKVYGSITKVIYTIQQFCDKGLGSLNA